MHLGKQIEDLVKDAGQDLFQGGTADRVEEAMKRSPKYEPLLREVRKVPAWAIRPMSSVIVRVVKWSATRIFKRSLTKAQALVLETALDGLIQGIIQASQQPAPPGAAATVTAPNTNPPAPTPATGGTMAGNQQVKAEFLRLVRTRPQAWKNWQEILILVRRTRRGSDDREVEFIFDIPNAEYLVDLLDINRPINEIMDMLLQSGVSIGGGRIDGWTKIEDVITGVLGGVARNPGIIFVFLAIGIISIAGLG